MSDVILLDPVLFDAIHLSSLAYGGIGWGRWESGGNPLCVLGHVALLGDAATRVGMPAIMCRQDDALYSAGVERDGRVPFGEWCEIVGVDVAS